MGIPGLAGFMKNRFKKWRPARKSDWENIVIDGYNIYLALYSSLDTQPFGGEYKRFKTEVEKFLTGFKKPIVVFDQSKDKSQQSLIEKRQDAMKKMQKLEPTTQIPRPLFLLNIFHEVLSAMDVEIRYEDEADKQMAILANKLKCPVLSSDSDFFIFDLKHGFLHFDLLHQEKPQPLYHITDFMSEFCIKSKELCLMLPLVLRKDIPRGTNQVPTDYDYISGLLQKLKEAESPSKFLADIERGSDFDTLKMTYSVAATSESMPGAKEGATTTPESTPALNMAASTESPESHIPEAAPQSKVDIACSNLKEEEGKMIISASLLRMQQGIPNVLEAVLEIIQGKSAWRISRKIRQYLAGFVGLSVEDTVTEFIREDGKTSFRREAICPLNLKKPVHIEDIKSMTKVMRCNLVLTVLGCHVMAHDITPNDIEEIFNRLDEQWKLPIAATFYWYKNEHSSSSATLAIAIVKALLLSFLTCSEKITNKPKPTSRSVQYQVIHAFAQWQCVYYDTVSLNSLAGKPFEITSPAFLFSGEVATHFVSIALKDPSLKSVLRRDSDERKLFNTLLYLATGCDLEGRKGKHARLPPQPATTNRFALLNFL